LTGSNDIITSEEEIIRQLRARDQKSVRYLYDHYGMALYGMIFKIVKNQSLSEELLQEAFVKIWNNFSSFDETKGKLYTWMLNVSRNLAIDKVRSNEYKLSSQTQNIEKSVNTLDKERRTSINEDTYDVKDLVSRLRPEQKELIDLIYFFGYTQAEAAEKLKMPLGTVKTRVRTAISELRKYFK
jgi:RNA polymerase sigma factor (sigma-70 family)